VRTPGKKGKWHMFNIDYIPWRKGSGVERPSRRSTNTTKTMQQPNNLHSEATCYTTYHQFSRTNEEL